MIVRRIRQNIPAVDLPSEQIAAYALGLSLTVRLGLCELVLRILGLFFLLYQIW